MTLINDHVLFPFTPQWARRPEFSRAWQNAVEPGVLGNETRLGLRAVPRRSLTFETLNLTRPELGQLNDALLAAKKSGLACAPFHGRAATLAADTEGDFLQLVETAWTWRAGDYVFFGDSAGFEVGRIAVVDIDMGIRLLTLEDALANVYPAGAYCWPLVFGKFSGDGEDARSPSFGPARITITELVSPAAAQLGEVEAPEGEGFGYDAVGVDFAFA